MADNEITDPIARARLMAAREALRAQAAQEEARARIAEERQRQETRGSERHRDLLREVKSADPLEYHSMTYRDLLGERREAENAAKFREMLALTEPGEVEAEEDAQVNIEPTPRRE